jgi:hypothetical protein
MGIQLKQLVTIAALCLLVYGCGKDKIVHEHYEQSNYVAAGPFKYCTWRAQIETCVWENVTCVRNWTIPNPVPVCYKISNAEGVVPEPTAPPEPSAVAVLITPKANTES